VRLAGITSSTITITPRIICRSPSTRCRERTRYKHCTSTKEGRVRVDYYAPLVLSGLIYGALLWRLWRIERRLSKLARRFERYALQTELNDLKTRLVLHLKGHRGG
jgi:hypothetical protein